MTELVSPSGGASTSPHATVEDVVELALLLPGNQAAALEAVAFQRGLTTGEMVRRLVREFLAAQQAPTSAAPVLFPKHVRGFPGI